MDNIFILKRNLTKKKLIFWYVDYEKKKTMPKLCYDPCDAIKMREMRGEVEKKTQKN